MFDIETSPNTFTAFLEDFIEKKVQDVLKKEKAKEETNKPNEVTEKIFTGTLDYNHNLWPDGYLITLGQIAEAKSIKRPQGDLNYWKKVKGIETRGGSALNTRLRVEDMKDYYNNLRARKTEIKSTRELKKGRVKL